MRTDILRQAGTGAGRSSSVTYAGTVWTVANATDTALDFEAQVVQTFEVLLSNLDQAGSARTRLLSVQVMLVDIADRPVFDRLWREWIGPDPQHWPQRACFQAALAPGLLVELVVVAAVKE